MTFDQIAWLPLCAGVTGAGLVLSFLLLRRRGAAAGLRAAAWSLLPMAAYLTGALPTLWQIGTAIVGFLTGLVFNPFVWAGVALTGLSAVLFVVSGVLRGRRGSAAGSTGPSAPAVADRKRGEAVTPGTTATQPLPRPSAPAAPAAGRPPAKPTAKPAADDDFSDIEEILKRRGIG